MMQLVVLVYQNKAFLSSSSWSSLAIRFYSHWQTCWTVSIVHYAQYIFRVYSLNYIRELHGMLATDVTDDEMCLCW